MNKPIKKIALYTGCFDPIHLQHLAIITSLMNLPHLDEVWILINGYSEEKSISLPFSVRKEMVQVNFLNSSSKLKIHEKPITFYTTDLVKELKKEDPQHDFYLVMGTDQANNLDQWEKAEDLPSLVKFLFIPRTNYPLNRSKLKKEWSWETIDVIDSNYVNSDFNSSQIRMGNDWNWLSPPTLSYIHQNCLYFPEILESKMSKERFQHSLGVAKLAAKIARCYQFSNLSQTFLAGLLHDVTKEFSEEQHLEIWSKNQQNAKDLKRLPSAVWHAQTGAAYLKQQFLITDQIILDAVYFHTTGRAKMSNLEKIIFVADKVDPLKKKPNMNSAYQMLFDHKTSFEDIFKLVLKEFGDELKKLRKTPTQETLEAQNYYLKQS